MKLISYYKLFSNKLSDWTLNFCILISGIMTLQVFLNVVARYVFKVTLFGGEELPRYLLIILTFLGASVALSRKRHVRLEAGINLFPKRIKYSILFLGNLLVGLFLVVLLYKSWDLIFIEGFRQRMTELRLPMFYIYIWMLIGTVLMLIHLSVEIIENIESFINPEKEINLDLNKNERII